MTCNRRLGASCWVSESYFQLIVTFNQMLIYSSRHMVLTMSKFPTCYTISTNPSRPPDRPRTSFLFSYILSTLSRRLGLRCGGCAFRFNSESLRGKYIHGVSLRISYIRVSIHRTVTTTYNLSSSIFWILEKVLLISRLFRTLKSRFTSQVTFCTAVSVHFITDIILFPPTDTFEVEQDYIEMNVV